MMLGARVVVPQCSMKPLPLNQIPGKYITPYQLSLVTASECQGKRHKLNTEACQTRKYPIPIT